MILVKKCIPYMGVIIPIYGILTGMNSERAMNTQALLDFFDSHGVSFDMLRGETQQGFEQIILESPGLRVYTIEPADSKNGVYLGVENKEDDLPVFYLLSRENLNNRVYFRLQEVEPVTKTIIEYKKLSWCDEKIAN